jgi:hypothetical protein
LLITICIFCAGCGTDATNCKPVTNLQKKCELQNIQ